MNAQTSCRVEVEKDKFTDKTTIRTPFTSGSEIPPISFGKMIKGSDTTFFLIIYLSQRYGNYSGKGAYLIFQDGEKWVKESQPVEVKYISSNLYSYYTSFYLNKDDVDRLSKIKVTDVKLSDAAVEVKPTFAENFICSVNKVLEYK